METVSLQQAARIIAASRFTGRSVLVRGPMGIGKSSLLKIVHESLPDPDEYVPVYFDCNTAVDAGDLGIPVPTTTEDKLLVTTTAASQRLGLQIRDGRKVLLMIDEFAKQRSLQRPLARLLLEQFFNEHRLPAGSIVFGTTNMVTEGLGDVITKDLQNRITELTLRKPTAQEWVSWAVVENLNPALVACVRENPQMLDVYTGKESDDNPYIDAPSRTGAFVTPRSLHAAATWVDLRDKGVLTDDELVATLGGVCGKAFASTFNDYLIVGKDMTPIEDILKDPEGAPMPRTKLANVVQVVQMASSLDKANVSAFSKYAKRFTPEFLAIFGELALPRVHHFLTANNSLGDFKEVLMALQAIKTGNMPKGAK